MWPIAVWRPSPIGGTYSSPSFDEVDLSFPLEREESSAAASSVRKMLGRRERKW